MLEEVQRSFPLLIKVIKLKENSRQGAARNAGIKIAKGEYIGFVDADDWVDGCMFEKLYTCARVNNYDIVGCHNYVVGSNEENIYISKTNTYEQTGVLDCEKRKKLLVNGGNIWLKIYRRELLIKNALFFPERVSYEDNYFMPMVMLYANSFGLVDEPLYYYYLSENSTVRKKNSNTQFQRFEVLDMLINEVKSRGVFEEYQLEFEYLKIVLFYVNTAKMCVIQFKPANKMMLRYIRSVMKHDNPAYYKNPYYISRFSIGERLLIRCNDISIHVFVILCAMAWKMHELLLKRRKKI